VVLVLNKPDLDSLTRVTWIRETAFRGAETQSQAAEDRPLTAEELERVTRRYPED
jgi:hypothetical protein